MIAPIADAPCSPVRARSKSLLAKATCARLSGAPSRQGRAFRTCACPGAGRGSAVRPKQGAVSASGLTLKDHMATVEHSDGNGRCGQRRRRAPPRFHQHRRGELRRRRRRRLALSADQPDEPVGRRARARPDRGRHLGDPARPGDQDDLAQAADLHPPPDPAGDRRPPMRSTSARFAIRRRSPSGPSRASRNG